MIEVIYEAKCLVAPVNSIAYEQCEAASSIFASPTYWMGFYSMSCLHRILPAGLLPIYKGILVFPKARGGGGGGCSLP